MDEPFDQPLLHTVRGMGYVLEQRAVVEQANEQAVGDLPS
jgi:hypothetical protein